MKPNELPKPKPVHVRKNGGYVSQSAGFDVHTPTPRVIDSPKAIRVNPRPIVTKPKASPVVVTKLSAEEVAARKAAMTKPSPWRS